MNTNNLPEYIPVTVEDLACYWFHVYAQHNKSPSSLKRDQGMLRNYIIPELGSIALATLKTRTINEWFAKIQHSQLSPKSCNDILGLLKKIIGDGEKWEFISTNPVARVSKKALIQKDVVFWTIAEIRQYLGFWTLATNKARIYYPTILALYTGMRRGELIALRWESVDFNTGFINVCDSYCRIAKKMRGTTKSNKARKIPICTILQYYLEELRPITMPSEYVLPFIDPDHYNRGFRHSAVVAGVKKIRFHDLRHTFASQFLMAGGNIYDLQKILGHSSIQVTEVYTHLIPEYLKGKTEILNF